MSTTNTAPTRFHYWGTMRSTVADFMAYKNNPQVDAREIGSDLRIFVERVRAKLPKGFKVVESPNGVSAYLYSVECPFVLAALQVKDAYSRQRGHHYKYEVAFDPSGYDWATRNTRESTKLDVAVKNALKVAVVPPVKQWISAHTHRDFSRRDPNHKVAEFSRGTVGLFRDYTGYNNNTAESNLMVAEILRLHEAGVELHPEIAAKASEYLAPSQPPAVRRFHYVHTYQVEDEAGVLTTKAHTAFMDTNWSLDDLQAINAYNPSLILPEEWDQYAKPVESLPQNIFCKLPLLGMLDQKDDVAGVGICLGNGSYLVEAD